MSLLVHTRAHAHHREGPPHDDRSFSSNVFPFISGGKVALNRGSGLRRFNATFPPNIKGKTLVYPLFGHAYPVELL